MTECCVLQCRESGAEILEAPKLGGFEALICSEHKNATDSGAPWMTARDSKSILMGNDLPAGLAEWQVEERVGTGVVLTVKTDRPEDKAFELYLTKDSMENLAKAFRLNDA